jgi:hypothetical protein
VAKALQGLRPVRLRNATMGQAGHGQADGSGNLAATLAADRAFPAAVGDRSAK